MGIFDGIRDIFDANTASDRRKRKQRGEPEWYAAQQRAKGNRVSNNPWQRATNSGRAILDTASKAVDQVNPLDGNRTWQQRRPTTNQSAYQQWANNKVNQTIGLSTGRVGTGMIQGVGGAYDLLTPGEGTNRLSDWSTNTAQGLDALAKEYGVETAYKMLNVPLEIASYAIPGVNAAKAARLLPTASKMITKSVDNTANIIQKDASKFGQTVADGMKRGLTPEQVMADIMITNRYLGQDAAQGKEITPERLLMDVATGVAGGTVSPLVLDWLAKGVKGTANQVEQATEIKPVHAFVAGEEGTSFDKKLSKSRQSPEYKKAKETGDYSEVRRELEKGKYGELFTGPDDKLRYEVSDHKADINYDEKSGVFKGNDGTTLETNKKYKLSDVLKHDELFKEYPNLADVSITVSDKLPKGVAGRAGGREIEINSKDVSKDELMDTVIHEIDHIIQQKENFARGGGIKRTVNEDKLIRENEEKLEKVMKQLHEAKTDEEFNRIAEQANKHIRKLEKLEKAGAWRYFKLGGEAQSRTVEVRRKMTPAERKKRPFYEDSDVPKKEQIVVTNKSAHANKVTVTSKTTKKPEAPKQNPKAKADVPKEKPRRTRQIQRVHVMANNKNLSDKQRRALYKKVTGKTSSTKMTTAELEQVIKAIDPTASPTPKHASVRVRKQADSGKSGMESLDETILSSQAQKDRYKATTPGDKTKRAYSETKRHLIDPDAPFASSDSRAAKRGDTRKVKLSRSESTLPAKDRLTKKVGDVRNSDIMAEAKIKDRKYIDGKQSLQDVMKKYPETTSKVSGVKTTQNRFIAYTAHLVDMENRGHKDGVKLFPQKSTKEVERAIKSFEKEFPEAKRDAQTIKKFMDKVLDEAAETGFMTKADADNFKKSRQFYLPTRKAESDELTRGIFTGHLATSNREQDIAMSRKKGGANYDLSWQVVIDRFYHAQKQINEQKLFNEQYKRAAEGEQTVRRISLKEATENRNAIHGFHKGNKVAIEVTPEMKAAYEKMSPEMQKNTWDAMTGVPVKVFKTVFTGTLGITFQALQPMKNTAILWHNKGLGSFGFRPIVTGIQASFGRGKMGERAIAEFGGNVVKATKSVSHTQLQAELLSLKKTNPASVAKFAWNHKWQSLKELGNELDRLATNFTDKPFRAMAAEQARIRAKKKGLSDKEAMEAAAYEYNESMGNFNRVTQTARNAEPILLYSGAIQAGARAFIRPYKNNPVQAVFRDAAAATGMAMVVGGYMSHDAGQEFAQDMKDSNKEYILDDNAVIVMPWAHKVDDKEEAKRLGVKNGEWIGVVKVPLAPDFRPMNRQVRKLWNGEGINAEDISGHFTGDTPRSVREIEKNNPIWNTLKVGMNKDPRSGQDIVKPSQQGQPKSKQIDEDYTTDAAKTIGGFLNQSPMKVDRWLDQLGVTGDMIQNRRGSLKTTLADAFSRQFTHITGRTKGGHYYNNIQEVSKTLTDEKDYTAFIHLYTNSDKKGMEDSAERAKILRNRPEVLKAVIEMNKRGAQRGEASNPLYELPMDQMKKVLLYRESKPLNSAKQNKDGDGNSLFISLGMDEKWYQDFKDKEDAFYDKIYGTDQEKTEFKTYSGAKQPDDPAMEKLQEAYHQLPKGTGARSSFLDANPGLLNYWAAKDNFTNMERLALGLKLNDNEDGSSPYYASSGGSGSGGSSGSGKKRYSSKGGSGGGGSSSGKEDLFAANYIKNYGKGTPPAKTAKAVSVRKVAYKKRGSQAKKIKVTKKKIRLA